MNPQLLSSKGSDRATGYNLSNKIIRHDGRLYTAWLDAPPVEKGLAIIRLGVCDGRTGALQNIVTLGHGVDNHCGPALAVDHDGRMHTVIGGHHTPFQYRYSDNPADEASWSEPESMGPRNTYPSLVADGQGTLHMVHREGALYDSNLPADRQKPYEFWYRRKKAGRPWEAPVAITTSPTAGYCHFMQSLSVGPAGALHLFFQHHYTDGDLPNHMRGRMGVYLRSDDGGDTWFNEGKRCELPLPIEASIPFFDCPQRGLRINNHVVDSEDRPWVFSSITTEKHGILQRRAETGWETVDIGGSLGNLNMSGGHSRDAAITRGADGNIHVVIATNPDDQPSDWYHPRHELFHMVLEETGHVRSFGQFSATDPKAANWLPAPENWDWVRKETVCADGPWLLYTKGLNLGGIGGQNANAHQTEVYLTHL